MARTPRLALGAAATAMACGLIAAAPARADSPPYVTDDTGIADKLELMSFVRSAWHPGARFTTFGLDLVLPLNERWELTFAPRFEDARHGDRRATGLGDTEVAVKYLVQSETASRPAIALEPNLTFPTAAKHLGAGRLTIDLPVLISKTLGPWKLSGQFGFEREGFNPVDDHAPISLLLERTMSERLTLGVEVAHDLPMRRPGHGTSEVNVGASWVIRDGLALQTAFGRRLAGEDTAADLHSTLALAVEF
jgi:hypothetical protein